MSKLELLRKQRGLNMKETASLLGMPYTTYVSYEKGQREPNSEVLIKIADFYETTVDFILGVEKQPDSQFFTIPGIDPIPKMKKVPRLGTIACGEPILAEQNIDGYDLIEETIKCDFTLKCKGDSMINARIFDGDIVYIRQQSDVDDGEIAAVLINNEATLKKVFKTSDKLVLRACNPMYDDLVYTNSELENIRILGKAVAFTSVVR